MVYGRPPDLRSQIRELLKFSSFYNVSATMGVFDFLHSDLLAYLYFLWYTAASMIIDHGIEDICDIWLFFPMCAGYWIAQLRA
jgi:hypothetical protein